LERKKYKLRKIYKENIIFIKLSLSIIDVVI
jgi:hypothetical protein